MLKEGIDLYVPLVDDFGIDAIIRKPDGTFIELQIKARSKDVVFGDAVLFTAITHEIRANYIFCFILQGLKKHGFYRQRDFVKSAC
jgi:hypothetical protein